MVLTRSMCKVSASIDGGSGATPKAGNSRHGTNTVVHGDAARVAVDKHASARGRRTKSNSALQPQIYTEDKHARSHSRAAASRSDTPKRPGGQKPSRGTKPPQVHQVTKQGRGSKFSTSLTGPSGNYLSLSPGSYTYKRLLPYALRYNRIYTVAVIPLTAEPIVGGAKEKNRDRRSDRAGTKRNREPDEDAPESEAAPRANARRVRRRVDGIVDQAGQRNAITPETSPENEYNAGPSRQPPRRSARLASKSSTPVPQYRCSSTEDAELIVDWRNQSRRKRTRTQEQCEDATEASSSRRTRRRICAVAGQSNVRSEGRTSGSDTKTESSEGTLVESRPCPSNADRPERDEEGSSSVPLVKNEDVDQDWLLVAFHERHTSVDSLASAYRESIEPRSSSIESLLTPPPPCTEEDGQVLLHHDFDAMIPLDSIPDEDERDAMNQAYLRQQQDHTPDDEADMAANRYRSLAPEPDQGLVDAIRSGRISGLASPERLMREE
ncbi:hypothetical protein ACEPAF_2130 [Sanghuangporus sanghuang]